MALVPKAEAPMPDILVIDDHPELRGAIENLLARNGYSVRGAKNGREGLEAFHRSRPDLVITDIFMPEKDGIETILAMRALDRDIPVLAISGGGRARNQDFPALALKLGATALLAKPFRAADLLASVRRLLAERCSGDSA
jgi:CheY-like chemotaxis protein